MATSAYFLYLHPEKGREGNANRSLLLYHHMTTQELIHETETFVAAILADEPEFFLVSLRVKPTNNIKIFLDGDNGLPIEKCVYINRKLYKLMEEKAFFPEGDFSLEVSSPGVEEPLQLPRQYRKNIGRNIEVVYKDETKKTGKLIQVSDADIIIEETTGKGKKAVTQQIIIPLDNIKTTIVQIQF